MIVGLTGGIGAGKTTVANLLAQRGAFVVQADEVAREVVARGSAGLAQLVGAFGRGILQPDGTLDRQRLADIAFADEGQRATLNSIMHPLIAARTAELFAGASQDAILVHDVALLTELGLAGGYDLVIVVDCPDEVRIARLLDRGLTEADARARIAAQATREQRLAVADVVIDNSGDQADLERRVEQVWAELLAPAKLAAEYDEFYGGEPAPISEATAALYGVTELQ